MKTFVQLTLFAPLVICTLLHVSSANTTQSIDVQGKCEPMDFSVYSYKFKLDYTNQTLPEGTKVEFSYGFGGHGSVSSEPAEERFHWRNAELKEALLVSTHHWSSNAELYYMATGGYFSDLEFRIKITLPDGTIQWDTGGNPQNYINALFYHPQGLTCDKMLRFTPLKVSVVKELEID